MISPYFAGKSGKSGEILPLICLFLFFYTFFIFSLDLLFFTCYNQNEQQQKRGQK